MNKIFISGELRAEFQPVEPEVIVSHSKLHIADDYGTETYIKTVYCESFLGFRNALRDLNPGHIPIFSDYDCTGLVCAQWCKLLAVYKTGRGITGVVEISVTRDV